MIDFNYRNKWPHFVPLCNRCKREITDTQLANLEITRTGDSRIVCLDCEENDRTEQRREERWEVWTRLSDVVASMAWETFPKLRKDMKTEVEIW